MRALERKRFRFQRQEEDADEASVMIAREGLITPDAIKPWSCEPCGTLNNEPRLNCCYCGRERE